jgi:DNA polymerase-3 subunit delta'
VGRALTLDLGVYLASRQDALVLLRTALWEPDYSQLFHATESYRAGADGQEKTLNLLRALGSLIEDLLLIVAGTPQLIRNLDIEAELTRLSQEITLGAQASGQIPGLESSLDWIDSAARALVQVEQGMRRNLLRSLSLDAMAVGLSRD